MSREGLTLGCEAIGIAHSPFRDRASTPRQSAAAEGVRGTIELFPRCHYEDALSDLATWSHIWVLFWFQANESRWTPKVVPPRSHERRGVFATRAPYRPNPIGLSACRLLGVDGLVVHVENVDFIDGTPVLDLKPYVPYTDSIPTANHGWLDIEAARAESSSDPLPKYEVRFEPEALAQLQFLRAHGIDLAAELSTRLGLGPEPHAYRRIRRSGDGYRIAIGEWRADFRRNGRVVTVIQVRTGYRAKELATSPDLDVHREFVRCFSRDTP